jgi:hypothetical protein
MGFSGLALARPLGGDGTSLTLCFSAFHLARLWPSDPACLHTDGSQA